jgi:hypothetical protein
MSLGFMLHKKSGASDVYDISSSAKSGNGNPMLMMNGSMRGREMTESKLRRDLLAFGDKIGHIFSCMNWDLTRQTASFWMCDDVFEQFKDNNFSLIRAMDGTACLTEAPGLAMQSALIRQEQHENAFILCNAVGWVVRSAHPVER